MSVRLDPVGRKKASEEGEARGVRLIVFMLVDRWSFTKADSLPPILAGISSLPADSPPNLVILERRRIQKETKVDSHLGRITRPAFEYEAQSLVPILDLICL